jgi:hypothetical protein
MVDEVVLSEIVKNPPLNGLEAAHLFEVKTKGLVKPKGKIKGNGVLEQMYMNRSS